MANFSLDQNGKRCRVALSGNFTLAVIPELQEALKTALAGIDELVFDLDRTTLLDSSGIGLLIAASNSLAKTNGKVRVVNASGDILRLLQTMRLVTRLNAVGREGQGGE